MSGYGLMFHHFHDDNHPAGQGAINADQFSNILDYSGIDRVISPTEWLEKARSGGLNEADVCITFDDNLSCQYDVALPVMEKLNVQAFWFVYTSPFKGEEQKLEVYKYFRDSHFSSVNEFYKSFFYNLQQSHLAAKVMKHLKKFKANEYLAEFPFYTEQDRVFRFVRDVVLGQEAYFDVMDLMLDKSGLDVKQVTKKLFMNEQQIRYLSSNGHIIGLHSHSHPTRLEGLSYSGQFDEYQENYHIIKEITGTPPCVMSHPCNSYNKLTLEVLEKLGVESGFRSNMSQLDNRGRYELPREDHANILAKLGKQK